MKKTTTLLIAIGMILMTLNSCKKEAQHESMQNDSMQNDVKVKVTAWLEKHKNPAFVNLTKKVAMLAENLDFSSMHIEGVAGKEKVAVIPIKDAYKTFGKLDQNVTLNLIAYLDTAGNVRYEEVAIYTPATNTQTGVLPASTYYNIDHLIGNVTDGQYRFLSVSGQRQSELKYKEGRKYTTSLIKPKSKTAAGIKLDALVQQCIDWYATTYYYDENGLVYNITETFLQTACELIDDTTIDYIAQDELGGGEPTGYITEIWMDTDAPIPGNDSTYVRGFMYVRGEKGVFDSDVTYWEGSQAVKKPVGYTYHEQSGAVSFSNSKTILNGGFNGTIYGDLPNTSWGTNKTKSYTYAQAFHL